jgi:hypothetical protein
MYTSIDWIPNSFVSYMKDETSGNVSLSNGSDKARRLGLLCNALHATEMLLIIGNYRNLVMISQGLRHGKACRQIGKHFDHCLDYLGFGSLACHCITRQSPPLFRDETLLVWWPEVHCERNRLSLYYLFSLERGGEAIPYKKNDRRKVDF